MGLPACVAGYDIQKIVLGAQKAYRACMPQEIEQNAAYRYGVGRRILNERGKVIEVFCAYEPKMQHLLEWLKQLFGESEGKENKGIFPTSLVFSRDLHSMGQFLQEGTPIFFETVLSVATPQKKTCHMTAQSILLMSKTNWCAKGSCRLTAKAKHLFLH